MALGLALIVLVVLVLLRKPTDVSGLETDLRELRDSIHLHTRTDPALVQSVAQIERTLIGAQTRGAVGEQLLDNAIAAVPPTWIERDFRVNNKPVEFALKLPNGLVIPIDSKWPAQRQIERLGTTDDPEEQRALKDLINKAVITKAKEVKKYLDPNLTTPFGVAAVPDAVFAVSSKAINVCARSNIVVLSYSMVLPYILLVMHTTATDRSPVDLQRVMGHLTGIADTLQQLQIEVEGRYSKGLVMLQNSRDECRVMIAKALSSLTAIDEDSADGR